jgi:hypothetical protein
MVIDSKHYSYGIRLISDTNDSSRIVAANTLSYYPQALSDRSARYFETNSCRPWFPSIVQALLSQRTESKRQSETESIGASSILGNGGRNDLEGQGIGRSEER